MQSDCFCAFQGSAEYYPRAFGFAMEDVIRSKQNTDLHRFDGGFIKNGEKLLFNLRDELHVEVMPVQFVEVLPTGIFR